MPVALDLERATIADHRVTLAGRRGRPLVLCVRLASREAGLWDGLWANLADTYRLAAIDLPQPTVGQLADPGRLLAGYARACLDVALGLGEPRFHVIGWNGGAQIGLQVGLQAARGCGPGLLSLTLITPFHTPRDPRPIEAGLAVLEHLLKAPSRDLYVRYWMVAGLSDRFIQERFDEVEALVQRRLAGDSFIALDVARAMRWMRALRHAWLSPADLAAIAVPTLIVAAGRDRWLAGPTLQMAEDLAAALPASQLVRFDELGGHLLIEDASAVAGPIRRFLYEHEGVP